ncbi:unnamed protein product [Brachionus calyciflorus]|uniref:Uncharacterized protein n=1 Tax=Brachionus calyciflorus TaxID=104777 RepID=A0A813Q168_9BILA|nr:unnamed protein product [Brachionus calyciflorus]
MAFYEVNGKRISLAEYLNQAQPIEPIYAYVNPQPKKYVQIKTQPEKKVPQRKPNVIVQTIPHEPEEPETHREKPKHHDSVLAKECKCEFCFNLNCDCHSCNPRRYCKCFYCERLKDQDQKLIIKKDFLPSEQIQKDIPITKRLDRQESSNQIKPIQTKKSWYE